LGTSTTINSFTKWSNSEVELDKKFHLAKHSIHKALCGKFLTLNYFLPLIYNEVAVLLRRCDEPRRRKYHVIHSLWLVRHSIV